jgi:hypothetical protein
MELEVVGFVVVSLPDILMFIVKLILFFCYNSMADKYDEILFRLREISPMGKWKCRIDDQARLIIIFKKRNGYSKTKIKICL